MNELVTQRERDAEEITRLRAQLAAAKQRIESLEGEKVLLQGEKVPQDHACYACEKRTNCLAGNPSLWPIALPYHGGNGKLRWWHMGCAVNWLEKTESLERSQSAMREALEKAKALVHPECMADSQYEEGLHHPVCIAITDALSPTAGHDYIPVAKLESLIKRLSAIVGTEGPLPKMKQEYLNAICQSIDELKALRGGK